MLEANGALRTWAIAELPRSWRRLLSLPASVEESATAEQLPDHRLDYLDYEGSLSGDRGTVTRVDSGTFAPLKGTSDSWVIDLSGQTIRGQVTLEKIPGQSSAWQLTFEPSRAADR